MTRLQRLRYVFRFFRKLATDHGHTFEKSKSMEVARTYGLFKDNRPDAELVKRIKARFRCELSFGGEGK